MQLPRPHDATLDDVLRAGEVASVYQPIVDLDTGQVVAYEALARGPQGPLREPVALFAAARDAGRLAELDLACRAAAVAGATRHGLLAPLMLFVNVEPELLASAPLGDLIDRAEAGGAELRVVLEITERALANRPAELLRSVQRVRDLGWGIALDDVGAESTSLAFMPLLRPDIVKLDLRLVQGRPDPAIAEIMNAVNAYAERTGALVLAEGIESERHVRTARALGATLGQGYLFGRPSAGSAPALPTGRLTLPTMAGERGQVQASPFDLLPPGTPLRRSTKSLLVEVSKQLEREAMRLGETCVVASTFQEARHFTAGTAQRYRDLVERTGFVCALGEGLPLEPVPGLRGAALAPDDPLLGEWDVVVLAPHFAAALLARDLGDDGPDAQRRFEFALTYERETVVAAAQSLVSRVAPRPRVDVAARLRDASGLRGTSRHAQGTRAGEPGPGEPATDQPGRAGTGASGAAGGGATGLVASLPHVLQQALAATTNGLTIVDVQRPDQPLVYVNSAFEALSGLPGDQLLGRNCRFLQGPDTDPTTLAGLRTAVAAGREFRGTLLNYRGRDRTPWWNELHLSPVVDADGVVVQYIGVQNDVTRRVEAERALSTERDRERDRERDHLARVEQLVGTDPDTGLLTRRRLRERAEVALWNARADGDAVAVVVVEFGSAGIADLGLAAADALAESLGARLSAAVRRSDLVARLSDRRFAVVLTGLAAPTAVAEAQARAQALTAALTGATSDDLPTPVQASTGTSVFPADGADLDALLRYAVHRLRWAASPNSPGTPCSPDSPGAAECADPAGARPQTSISASTRGS